MLKLKPKHVTYTHSVDIFDLPESLQTAVRNHANENSDLMLDYMDGDFYFLVDFSDLIPDPTPEEEVQRLLEDEADEEGYPFRDWKQYRDDFTEYLNLLRYEHAVRFIRDNLPAEVVETNKIAIHVWH